ncbi:class I SAM-dependent methyltransferase [Prochlorococcus sp. MIT 1307]|uniref:class I SAM-dependent methyltransferase n=1 Tax=Prochlorococcus sp. MIT 1307 TaxID=3096219 RepID=UPI002A75A290|nr:methyltransferase domain-containing protein [Prochlorococcus sp. MIT 1307]
MHCRDVDVSEFLRTGFNLKSHLATFLQLTVEQVDSRLSLGSLDLATFHPGSIDPEDTIDFYEDKVGTRHLFDLAAWHLSSANYIADTLRLQQQFARGQVLDFGGGIGTHALAAAALPDVDHVWYVDLNPENRNFVEQRSKELGLVDAISVHRDLENTGMLKFDTLICLDVLEHISNPSSQITAFHECLSVDGIALMNWYFYKGNKGEYPFHFDDPVMIENFFRTLQSLFIEVFHPFLITTRAYRTMN